MSFPRGCWRRAGSGRRYRGPRRGERRRAAGVAAVVRALRHGAAPSKLPGCAEVALMARADHRPMLTPATTPLSPRTQRHAAVRLPMPPPGRFLAVEHGPELLLLPLAGPVTTIGRSPAADVELDDHRVAARHAAVVVRDAASCSSVAVRRSRSTAPPSTRPSCATATTSRSARRGSSWSITRRRPSGCVRKLVEVRGRRRPWLAAHGDRRRASGTSSVAGWRQARIGDVRNPANFRTRPLVPAAEVLHDDDAVGLCPRPGRVALGPDPRVLPGAEDPPAVLGRGHP